MFTDMVGGSKTVFTDMVGGGNNVFTDMVGGGYNVFTDMVGGGNNMFTCRLPRVDVEVVCGASVLIVVDQGSDDGSQHLQVSQPVLQQHSNVTITAGPLQPTLPTT